MPNPQLSGMKSFLTAVSADTASDVWAVGDTYDPTTFTPQTLIEHYAGPPSQVFCR